MSNICVASQCPIFTLLLLLQHCKISTSSEYAGRKEGGSVLVPRYSSGCRVAGRTSGWTPIQWGVAATAAYLADGEKKLPQVLSNLRSLEISPLQRRVPVSESRDELCPPWTQNSEYLWPKALFVKLCESADLLWGGGSSMVQFPELPPSYLSLCGSKEKCIHDSPPQWLPLQAAVDWWLRSGQILPAAQVDQSLCRIITQQ